MTETDETPGAAPDPDAGWREDLSRAAACQTALWHDRAGRDPAGIATSARAYPVVGAALGVLAAAAYGLGDWLGFYGLASAALAFALVAGLTGARGEAGAAAFAARLVGDADEDGEAGDGTAAQAGLVLVVLGLVVKIGLVAAVSFAGTGAAILVAAVAVSRMVMPLAAGWGGEPAAVRVGEGDTTPSGGRLWVVALVAVLFLILFLGVWGAVVSTLFAAVAAVALLAASGRTGGLDRPALWAIQQGVELAILAGAVATL